MPAEGDDVVYPLGRRPQFRSSLFWVISSWIVATVLGLGIVGTMTGTGKAHVKSGAGTLAGLSPSQPLLGGHQVPLATASGIVGFSVPIPDNPVASQDNLTATWVAASRQQVALVFSQGEIAIVMKPVDYEDAASEFNAFVSENNAQATVGDVNGQPALVISPDTDYDKTNPAWVEIDLNGIDVNIFSASYSTDQLLGVADSMVQSVPSPSPSPSSGTASR